MIWTPQIENESVKRNSPVSSSQQLSVDALMIAFVKMGNFSKPGHSFYINRVYQRGLLAMASLFIKWEQSQIQAVVGLFLLTQLPRYKSGLVGCCVILHLDIPDSMTQLLLGQHLLEASQSL